MSALDALRTSVSGMNAQSQKLSGISNNIANSSTVGYKRVDTQFESLVLEGSATSKAVMAGTSAKDRVQISKAGQVQTTSSATDVAVNGDGYMVVNENANSTGKYLATRAGSFRPDANGNLVNTAGYYLQGVPVDATGAAVAGLGTNLDSLKTVNINNVAVASAPTTKMTMWSNLQADQTAASATVPTPSLSSVDYYDALGAAQTLTYQFTPTQPTAPATAATNQWTMKIFDSATTAAGTLASPAVATDPLHLVATVALTFDNTTVAAAAGPPAVPAKVAGTLSAASVPTVTGTGVSYNATTGLLTIPAVGGKQSISVNIGAPNSTSGITQMQGAYTETKIEKDGSAFGLLQGVGVQSDGLVMATFSNGKSRPIYQLKLATMPSPDQMTPVHGDAYIMSPGAGSVRLLNPGSGSAGTTTGNSLEASNVDMGTELTNLIETQRAYSSNATVIQTADQMLQTANDLKR